MDVTQRVIDWTLSKPVLGRKLAHIAHGDEFVYGDDDLACWVVDLLWPQRNTLAVTYLAAVGASIAEADATWAELDKHESWVDAVHWDKVRDALIERYPKGAESPYV
jgi:hypothetical protein